MSTKLQIHGENENKTSFETKTNLGTLSPEGTEPEAAESSEEEQIIELGEIVFPRRRLGFTKLNRIMDLDEWKPKESLLLVPLIEDEIGRW